MISELTEMTEPADDTPFSGWIFYDGDCSFCCELARRFDGIFARRGFRFEPLQHEWVLRRLSLTREVALEEMRVLTSAGEVFGGADAVVELARRIWWAAPLAFLARFRPVHRFFDRAYRWVAARRTCAINRTAAAPWTARTRWLLLAVLPCVALSAKPFFASWAFMWLMAFALFIGCKWLTLGRAIQGTGRISPFRAAAYLLAWPGMDAARFLSPDLAPPRPRGLTARSAVHAGARILFGAFLLFVAARHSAVPLLAGWIGMIGMILILHFGVFDLSSAAWRALRVDAPPLMDRPLRSTSVSEFWGRRWNAAFNDLAVRLVFRPAARRSGIVGATWLAFTVSGLIHELVISLPAGAGFGLPTAYFLTQALGISAERSSVGKLLKLNRGVPGWLFTMLIVAGPAYWLFHPPFVRRVILPFMHAIGAL